MLHIVAPENHLLRQPARGVIETGGGGSAKNRHAENIN